jgi:tetratricopeptide (TPR) repeat protein
MRCPECKHKVPEGLLLCPQCGTLLEETQPLRARRSAIAATTAVGTPTARPAMTPAWRRVRTVLLWLLAFVLVISLSVAVAAYLGLQRGEQDKEAQRLAAIEEHYRKGLERLDSGDYVLAIAEFEYVLKLDPQNGLARQGIAEAQARQRQQATLVPTPTSEMVRIVTDDLYRKALAHYQAGRWADAAALLTQLRALDPDYQTDAVKDMLFTSLYRAGMALLDEDRFEEGVFYLDQAIALRPLDARAVEQRNLAVQYMTAVGYWGVDWELCIRHFKQLYAAAPNYKDVLRRLYRAYVTYADAWASQGEMCPAQELYASALQYINDASTEQKRAEAEQVCLVATPTPIAPLTGTTTITMTVLPPGFTSGRLAYPVYNNDTGTYDIYALFADGRLLRMVSAADQPNWMWSGGGLGYRDLSTPGIALLSPGNPTPRVLASGAGWAWPTFSPDGGRVAFAAQNTGGTWQVFIAPVDGSTLARIHADGRNPAWGPTGLLAWTGCDATGACGIFVDNPDDDQAPTRMTASSNDIGLAWAPGGAALAYMSDVTGNWDIYLLSVSGGVSLLTDDPSADGLPAWAPDGSGIAFVSNRDGAWGVYLMGPNGEDPHKILTLGPNLPNWTAQRLSWVP